MKKGTIFILLKIMEVVGVIAYGILTYLVGVWMFPILNTSGTTEKTFLAIISGGLLVTFFHSSK